MTGKPLLVVVVLGSSGRYVNLNRLSRSYRVVLLGKTLKEKVSKDLYFSSYAHIELSPENSIDSKDNKCTADDENCLAYISLNKWISEHPKKRKIQGIVCYDDQGLELSAYLCEKFSLKGTPSETVHVFQNKALFRERCRENGLPSVLFKEIYGIDDIKEVIEKDDWPFPCILKPMMGAGSLSVRKVDNGSQLLEEYESAMTDLTESNAPESVKSGGFILEEYFMGEEVDIDGWVTDGKLSFQLVSDNNPALEPYFLEQGGTYPSQLPKKSVQALEKLTKDFFDVFPDVHGCFCLEAKINVETLEIMPIEMNGRCAGAECPFSVEAVTGHDLLTIAAYLALDIPYNTEEEKIPKQTVVCSANLYGNPGKDIRKDCRVALERDNNFIMRNFDYPTGKIGFMFFNKGFTESKKIGASEENENRNFIGWIGSVSTNYNDASALLHRIKINPPYYTKIESRVKCDRSVIKQKLFGQFSTTAKSRLSWFLRMRY